MRRLPQKHGYRSKLEFYTRGFLKFDHLGLTPNLLVGSETWLIRLFYDRESIPNVVYFFRIFLRSKMKEVQRLATPQLHVWMLPQKHTVIVRKQIIYYFIWTLVDSFYNIYSQLISLGNMVEKSKTNSQS